MKRSGKRSVVWDFLIKKPDNKVSCNICKREFKYTGNTSNLRDHLRRKHPGYLDQEDSDHQREKTPRHTLTIPGTSRDEDINDPSASCSEASEDQGHSSTSNEIMTTAQVTSNTNTKSLWKKSLQTKLFLTDKKTQLEESEREAIDRSLIKMIVLDFQPLSLVENTGFKEYSKHLQPLYSLPNRKLLSTKMLPGAYNAVRVQLIDILKEVKYLAVTTDIWTSDNNRAYISVTSHFAHNNQLTNAVLATKEIPETHTGINIAAALSDCFDEWDISQKIITIVSDNGANVKNAITEHLHKRHHPCVAHTLNLCLVEALHNKTDENMKVIEPLIAKCRAIVGHFKHSVVASEKLKSMQRQMGLSELKVKQDVSTRWNSTLLMIERLILIKEPLSAVITSLAKAPEFLGAAEWELLCDWVPILKPMEQMTVELSGEKYPTMSLIIPLVRGLQYSIKNANTVTPSGESLKAYLLETVHKRLAILETNSVCSKATFLDPRFKKSGFGLVANADSVQDLITKELIPILNVKNNEVGEGNEAETENVASDPSNGVDIWSHFDQKVSSIKTIATPAITAKLIVKQYLELPIIARSQNPMMFWKRHENSMPELYELYQKYSCIPATSVPSERLFSKSGQLTNDRRNRLLPKNLDSILFLNSNITKFKV